MKAGPPPDATPELADAWHRLQLHWLVVCPGYREAVRLKLVVALALEDARRGVCKGCGRVASGDEYTKDCKTCHDRRRGRERRQHANPVVRDVQQRQAQSEKRLSELTGY